MLKKMSSIMAVALAVAILSISSVSFAGNGQGPGDGTGNPDELQCKGGVIINDECVCYHEWPE